MNSPTLVPRDLRTAAAGTGVNHRGGHPATRPIRLPAAGASSHPTATAATPLLTPASPAQPASYQTPPQACVTQIRPSSTCQSSDSTVPHQQLPRPATSNPIPGWTPASPPDPHRAHTTALRRPRRNSVAPTAPTRSAPNAPAPPRSSTPAPPGHHRPKAPQPSPADVCQHNQAQDGALLDAYAQPTCSVA